MSRSLSSTRYFYPAVLPTAWLIVCFSCTSDDGPPPHMPTATENAVSAKDYNKNNKESIHLFPFDSLLLKACQNSGLNYLYNCSDSTELYQVELKGHFKDVVFLTATIKDSMVTNLYYTRFHHKCSESSIPPPSKYSNKVISAKSPLASFYVHFYYKSVKKEISDKALATDLYEFFSNYFWYLPESEKLSSDILDPETWDIVGRKPGRKELRVSRQSSYDHLFYSNIQKAIDVFNIKDYKY